MMKNIAYVALAPFISGSERSLQMILLHAKEENINPLLICPSNSPMLEWAKENKIRHQACSLSIFSLRSSAQWLRSQLKLIYLLLKYKIDIVHSNQVWSYPAIVYPAKITKCKVVCHLRDPIENSINWWLKSPPNSIVCVSKHILNELNEYYVKRNEVNVIEAIINPVSIPLHTIESKETLEHESKTKFKLSSNIITYGYIGQVAPIKGLTDIIHTLAKLTNKNWVLLIAGEDPSPSQTYKKECELLIKEYGLTNSIKFLGFQSNVSNFYYAVDCVLMFSEREPLGRVPLEAGAHFTPTIASDVDGLPETINHEVTGYLINKNEHINNALLISELTNSALIKLGLKAREFVELNAAPTRYIKKLNACYKYILGRN